MRILNKEAGAKSLDELGFQDDDLNSLNEAINSPQGMILVTGPTEWKNNYPVHYTSNH